MQRMFDTNSNAQQPGGATPQPENAPASFESINYGATAIEAGKLKPVTAQSEKDTGVPGDDVGVYEFQAPHVQSTWVLAAFIVLGVAALAGLAWWAYTAYTTSTSSTAVSQSDAIPVEENVEEVVSPFEDVIAPAATTTPDLVSPVTTTTPEQQGSQVMAATDTDGDGLADADEVTNGSDPRDVDTDDDGLNDREEVLVHGTSPTNPDSDGDTYLDGVEVKNGYNPKGAGMLLTVTATSTSAIAP